MITVTLLIIIFYFPCRCPWLWRFVARGRRAWGKRDGSHLNLGRLQVISGLWVVPIYAIGKFQGRELKRFNIYIIKCGGSRRADLGSTNEERKKNMTDLFTHIVVYYQIWHLCIQTPLSLAMLSLAIFKNIMRGKSHVSIALLRKSTTFV